VPELAEEHSGRQLAGIFLSGEGRLLLTLAITNIFRCFTERSGSQGCMSGLGSDVSVIAP